MPDRLIAVPELLRALRDRARSLGLAPPAAFLGDWRDRRAVVVPSVDLRPVAQEAAFAESDHLVVVYRSFPDTVPGAAPPLPAAVRGEASGWLTLEADGRWSRHGDAPDPEQVVRDHSRGRRHDRAAAGHNNDDHDGNDGNDGNDNTDYTDREAGRLPDWAAPDRAAHRAAVSDCLEAIRAGEVYQACLSTRLHGTLRADPLETFLAITGHAPAARSAYLEGPWGAVLGFSPEEYLVRRGQVVRSSPIKGTLSADRDPALLLQSAKDIAENIMIVDLVRNDLGRVADVGSVTVTDLLAIRPAPGVHHLVSTVTARTTADNTALVEATFPPASVTGTPKSRARELIAGWEPVSRGLHCGAYGFALGRDLELAVAIRTLEATHDGRVELGVGGGITIDSDPDAEWDECVHKAAFTWGGGPAPWGPG